MGYNSKKRWCLNGNKRIEEWANNDDSESYKEDSSNIITYLNEVAGETDYLSFGQGEFAFSIAEEAEYIEESDRIQALLCCYVLLMMNLRVFLSLLAI